jgi:hypothetical protein
VPWPLRVGLCDNQNMFLNVRIFKSISSMNQSLVSHWSDSDECRLLSDQRSANYVRKRFDVCNICMECIIITYLLRPRETVCFVVPRPPLLPEAKPRATTAVEGPQNTLLSRGLSK